MARTRYFVLRSINMQNIDKSVERGVWATQPHNEEKLSEAYAAGDEVLLIFSVNGSGHFQGYARMAGPVKAEQANIWEGDARVGGAFAVDWCARVDLQHSETDHLRNPWNEGKPVRICRDGTEVEPAVGAELVGMIDALAERVGEPRPGSKRQEPKDSIAGGGGGGSGMAEPGIGAPAPRGGGGGPGLAGPEARSGARFPPAELPPGPRGRLDSRPGFEGPQPHFGGGGGSGMMSGAMGDFGLMAGMHPMLAMGMMGGFGVMPFGGGGMVAGMPGFRGGGMMAGDFGGGAPFLDRPPPPPPPRRDAPGFGRPHGGFDGPLQRGGFHDGPGPSRFDGPPEFDRHLDGAPMWRGAGFDGPPPRGGPPHWDRVGRPPSPRFYGRYRSRSPERWGGPFGGRGGGPPPEFGRGPPQGEFYGGGSGPQRPPMDDRPNLLEMSYEEYLAGFDRVRELRGGAGGGAAGGKQAGQGDAGGAAAASSPGSAGVAMMSEEQYLAYCERYTSKMGLPFDPGMVRQHYWRMRETAGV